MSLPYHKLQFRRNEIKDAIKNNDPVDDNLHVIAVLSNPCLCEKRVSMMRDFCRRMEFENNVILYVVELAYGSQPFSVTSSDCSRHLQLRCDTPLFHKENMVNVGIRRLLPPDWKAVAWIDSNIDFENECWALDTLKVLNGCRDVVQLFSHVLNMDSNEEVMTIHNSFSFKYERGLPNSGEPNNYWQPGYAWACTRRAYETMGGLFDYGLLESSGDYILSSCLINRGVQSVNTACNDHYKGVVMAFQDRVKRLRLGYVPGVIRHFSLGSNNNNCKYVDYDSILITYNWSPSMIFRNDDGIYVPTSAFPEGLKADILRLLRHLPL